MSSLSWRLIVVAVALVLGLAFTLPSIESVRQSPLGHVLPGNQVSLGLDLKGGIHLTLGVDVEKALSNSLAQAGQDVKSFAQEKEMTIIRQNMPEPKRLEFVLATPDKKDAFEELFKKQFSGMRILKSEVVDDGKIKYSLAFTPEYAKNLEGLTVDQAVKTIRNRIDQFGVAEPDIRKQAGDRIQIQLPGLKDPDRAIALVGKTAHLEFKIVDDSVDPAKVAKGLLPPGREIIMERIAAPNGEYTERPLVVKSEAVMTGELIADARVNFDQNNNQPYVGLTFTSRGAKIFERVTGENLKKRMAIILDGKAYSAPVIQDKIAGGKATITGRYSETEARDLAVVLRAGALPAPVNVLEQRTVGPSLGQESIDNGVLSIGVACGAIALFMLVYYGFSGVIANVALVFNVVLIMAGLAMFGATLTLPGIAGIILTMALSVDANIIIFERIREEIRLGLPSRASIKEGFTRGSLTILDANVTTAIAALVLYEFGTGPIRGFAVTLLLGIVASMFTAIFVSHTLMDMWLRGKSAEARLSI
ncbi:protein translocase subunit SecD [Fundidesulfovibrio terrae]|uniref:protein translocase subunit SecD n=1 Tax=Fundidesulfovibrio terrae TaxID=2922866 RepID=UPI001FAF0BD3|nr:protein translocase subunit SecD [Fundidesulfovibrio terrae]